MQWYSLVHVGSPVYNLLCFASTPGQIKECCRKLNQHGHEWAMRLDQHTIERREELEAFCVLVMADRAENDETAEYTRTHELATNPDSEKYRANVRSVAEETDGASFDRFM
jgi:hypothetical protein